jgi:drug/metabolite transporter (DMT)-like permease
LIPIFIIAQARGKPLLSRRIILVALITGVFSIALSLVLYSYAVKFVGATVTSVIVASAPIFTAPLSAIYLKEEMGLKVVGGTILTVIGVVMVVIIL